MRTTTKTPTIMPSSNTCTRFAPKGWRHPQYTRTSVLKTLSTAFITVGTSLGLLLGVATAQPLPAGTPSKALTTEPNGGQLAVLDVAIAPFTADYVVLREGKAHGTAQRFLRATEHGYEIGYRSKISWLVFDDDRQEQSLLQLEQGQVRPYRYQMQREGSGPDRRYVVQLDRTNQRILQDKNKVIATPWRDDYQDMLSFMLQLTLDLQRGQTDFHYHVLNRHGEVREYRYKVTGEELLSLPYGQIKAIRIERYGQSPDKQVIAWVAPTLQYSLVRLWQSEENVEQFDVQLKQHSLSTITTK
jgi:hypothetical protein